MPLSPKSTEPLTFRRFIEHVVFPSPANGMESPMWIEQPEVVDGTVGALVTQQQTSSNVLHDTS